VPPVPQQIRLLAEAHPDEIAYRFLSDGTLSFRQWDERSSQVAHSLLDLDLQRGERVALLLDGADAPVHLAAYAGVHKAGGVNVPVNTRLSDGEVEAILRHAEPSLLIGSDTHHVELAGLAQTVPSVRAAFTTGPARRGLRGWDEVVAASTAAVQADVGDDDIADIIYTSGTTGVPKGVVIRHRASTPMDVDMPHWNGLQWFHASPFFTFAGLSFLFVPMRLGMTGVYAARFDARRFLDMVEAKQIQMCFLVPAMVELLVAEPDFSERDLSGLLMVTIGSAPIAPATLLRFQEQVPDAMVSNSYGMTEAGSAHMAMPKGELLRRPGSCGKPMPPVEVRIVDPLGEQVGHGETGEVVLRNPGREREYYRNETATAETWRDGWLHTGDLGRLDEDGYLYIVGRIKDVIIRGGTNIHAVDIEAVLYEHEAVQEAAVVGIPHKVLGEDVAAFVVAKPDTRIDIEELRAWCAERLADFKVPRLIELRQELPRNATGKVLKRELASQAAAAR
jgi:acyl-CoA synthetase (AMP-forming)/AMP-acid ligase II